MTKPIVVRAPATSANLGSGFDCLGLALDLWNEVSAVPGPWADSEDLVARSVRGLFEHVGAPAVEFTLRSSSNVPSGRGLGSSATAIVCGLLLANECLGLPLTADDLLALATRIEGHADNVVPCLLGGVRVATQDAAGRVIHAPVPLAIELQAVVFVPEQRILTTDARAVLPRAVPLQDALFNVARSSLLVAALASGRSDLLAEATRDRLHQPYRGALYSATSTLFRVAMDSGALAVYTSGAGPSVLALVSSDVSAASVADAFNALGLEGRTLRLGLSKKGAHVVRA
jgi:homoserine kinase